MSIAEVSPMGLFMRSIGAWRPDINCSVSFRAQRGRSKF